MTTLAPEIAMISIDPNKTIESISARQTLAGRSEHHRGGSLFWTPNRGPDPQQAPALPNRGWGPQFKAKGDPKAVVRRGLIP